MVTSSAIQAATRPCVLLVEDDDAVRRSLQMVLQGQGYDVRAHATGATLLADPRLCEAICLIADYRMASSDGLSVLARLRSSGWLGPAILVTAFGSADIRSRAAAAGFTQVFEKPFSGRALLTAVERLVDPEMAANLHRRE